MAHETLQDSAVSFLCWWAGPALPHRPEPHHLLASTPTFPVSGCSPCLPCSGSATPVPSVSTHVRPQGNLPWLPFLQLPCRLLSTASPWAHVNPAPTCPSPATRARLRRTETVSSVPSAPSVPDSQCSVLSCYSNY